MEFKIDFLKTVKKNWCVTYLATGTLVETHTSCSPSINLKKMSDIMLAFAFTSPAKYIMIQYYIIVD